MYGSYDICMPSSVVGWKPLSNFKTFIVKENAGENFTAVNNSVKKVCDDIDGIVASLGTLKTKMGENTLMTDEIKKVTDALLKRKEEVVTNNQKLIAACGEVVQYINQNQTSKSQEAAQIAQTLSTIQVYGTEEA